MRITPVGAATPPPEIHPGRGAGLPGHPQHHVGICVRRVAAVISAGINGMDLAKL
jgi:hypothetical protein